MSRSVCERFTVAAGCRLYEKLEAAEQRSLPCFISTKLKTHETSGLLSPSDEVYYRNIFRDTLNQRGGNLSASVEVGSQENRHVHKFTLKTSEKYGISLRYIDPESYLKRLNPNQPENSQVMSLDLWASGGYSLHYARFPVDLTRDPERQFRSMHKLEEVCGLLSEGGVIENASGCKYQGNPYALYSDTKGKAQMLSGHFLTAVHAKSRQYQILRVLEHAVSLCEEERFGLPELRCDF